MWTGWLSHPSPTGWDSCKHPHNNDTIVISYSFYIKNQISADLGGLRGWASRACPCPPATTHCYLPWDWRHLGVEISCPSPFSKPSQPQLIRAASQHTGAIREDGDSLTTWEMLFPQGCVLCCSLCQCLQCSCCALGRRVWPQHLQDPFCTILPLCLSLALPIQIFPWAQEQCVGRRTGRCWRVCLDFSLDTVQKGAPNISKQWRKHFCVWW